MPASFLPTFSSYPYQGVNQHQKDLSRTIVVQVKLIDTGFKTLEIQQRRSYFLPQKHDHNIIHISLPFF